MQFPFVLAAGTLVVVDGVDPAATATQAARWRQAPARPDGAPLFTPDPRVVAAPRELDALAAQHADVVVPAALSGRPVLVDGGPWRCLDLIGTRDPDALVDAVDRVYGPCAPDVLAVFPPHARALRRACERLPDLVLLRGGSAPALSLSLFDALLRRGLYGNGCAPGTARSGG